MRINFLEGNGTIFFGESFTSCKEMSWTSDEIGNLWFCVQAANQNEEKKSKEDREHFTFSQLSSKRTHKA